MVAAGAAKSILPFYRAEKRQKKGVTVLQGWDMHTGASSSKETQDNLAMQIFREVLSPEVQYYVYVQYIVITRSYRRKINRHYRKTQCMTYPTTQLTRCNALGQEKIQTSQLFLMLLRLKKIKTHAHCREYATRLNGLLPMRWLESDVLSR